MAASNLAVAAQFSVGVHRNLVTKSHKTMAAANPAVKYGAADVLVSPQHTRSSDRNFAVSIQSPLLHRNSFPRSLDTRIKAANPEVISSSNLMGVQFFTQCQFGNYSGQNLMLEDLKYWHGYGDIPENTFQNQSTVEFKHFGDSIGSVGAVSYLVGDKVRWIIGWSNSGEDSLKLNKVYSEIREVTEGGVDWGLIRETLDQSVSKYKATNPEYGYSADLIIDPTSTTPTMTATLNSYK